MPLIPSNSSKKPFLFALGISGCLSSSPDSFAGLSPEARKRKCYPSLSRRISSMLLASTATQSPKTGKHISGHLSILGYLFSVRIAGCRDDPGRFCMLGMRGFEGP